MTRNFYLLMFAQFVAALGDHALLIVAIARVYELSGEGWLIPVLKLSFTLSYVLLGAFVGPVADHWPKARVMLAANGLKVLAIVILAAGGEPLLVMVLAGLGAAIYAPAKYGLVCELLPSSSLVRANGFIEACTVCAVILGTVLGGLMVSPWSVNSALALSLQGMTGVNTRLGPAALGLFGLYSFAGLLNLLIKGSGARYTRRSFHPVAMVRLFFIENKALWSDRLGGLSMSVTTLLWGVGATLQLIVLRWGQEALGLSLANAAYLQGVTAVGVIAGAAFAARTVSLARAPRLLPLGIAMGLAVPMLSLAGNVWVSGFLLTVVGAFAGYFVVPMNALLQHRGHALLSAGRSIAVQGFNENLGILVILSLYAICSSRAVPLNLLIFAFGASVALVMALIMRRYLGGLRSSQKRR